MDLQAQLEELKETTQAKLAEMHGDHAKELQELRVQVLGKKGSLTELLKGLKERRFMSITGYILLLLSFAKNVWQI